MTTLQVRELGKDEYSAWDELVEKCPYGTIFHTSSWLRTCARSLGRALQVYACFEKGDLIGGCSVYVHRWKYAKTAHSILSLTPYGGVVLVEPESANMRRLEERRRSVIRALQKAFEVERFDYIQITNPPGFVDVRPFTWNGWETKVRYAYYLDLEGCSEGTLPKDVRWAARKAAENNVMIKKLDEPDLSKYYELYSMTFRRQNLKPPVSADFLQEIVRVLKSENAVEMWVAETALGNVASAEILVLDLPMAYRWSAASHTDFRSTGATSLLLCEIFRDLRKRGFEEIDLMAANTPHLAKFIAGFNPRLTPYYMVEKRRSLLRIGETIYNAIRNR